MRPFTVPLIALVVLSTPAAAATLTLARALELARERNPELLAARQEIEMVRGRLVRARSWNAFNPEIRAGAAARRFGGGGSETQAAAGTSMEIEIAGQRRKRIEEAESHLTRVEAEVADVERLLTARVEEAFYRTLYLRRRADLFGQVEELNRRMRDASEERFQSGEAAKSEANLGVVRHAQSRRDALAAARDHANAVRELEALIGAAPLGNTQPRGDLEAPAATRLAAQDLVETAWRARPDLRARDAELRRLAAQTALTRRLRVPNPTLSGFYDEEAESATGRDRIFGGAVSIPLPVFDRQQGEITALAGARLQAEHRKAAARLAVEAEVRQALAAYEAALATLRAFEAGALQRIDETFGLIESAYREGKIDLLQLVVAQNDLVGARFSHLDTLWDSWQARIALERAVGAPLEPGGDPPAGEPPVQP